MGKRAKRISKRNKKDEIEAFVAMEFGPLLTRQQVSDYEGSNSKSSDISRRITLAVLAQSKEQLVSNYQGLDAHEKMLDFVSDWKKHLEICIEFADSALTRLLSAMATAEKHAEDARVRAGSKP